MPARILAVPMIVADVPASPVLDAPTAAERRLAELERQLAKQETVLEITRSFASAPTLDQLLLTVADQTCAAVQADRTTFFLVDERAHQLWTKSTNALEIKEIRVPMGVGMSGHVAVTGEILNVHDCYVHPIWSKGVGPSIDQQTGYLTRTMLVMPVKSGGGRTIGVFQILNKLRADGTRPLAGETEWPVFSDEDVDFMESIAASAAIAVQNAYLVEQTKDMFTSTVQVLATTLDRRNPDTAGHSQRVALSAEILAKRMGLTTVEIEKIRIAGLLHDVGKIGVPEAVLNKNGKLDDEEFAQIRRHAAITKEILEQIRFLEGYEDITTMAGQHHEKLSGKGYPFGQSGDEITLGGRLLAVADIYDALRQRRIYKPAMPIEQALSILHADMERGDLDPKAVALLEECLDEIERVCGPLRPGWEEEQAAKA
ncbi:MAG TPA: HD domain-containing phosphohydrolase [Chloroflexota bacterium]|nr:HD domain-containing phosphohydrolase [Chloroflexota bacterium]